MCHHHAGMTPACLRIAECGAADAMLTLLVTRNLVGSRAGPIVAIPRTGSVVNPFMIRWRPRTWF
jgi:hypothetical protein